jgi:hypothetical protein
MAAADSSEQPKDKGGRPPDPRPPVPNVRVAAEDLVVLQHLEKRTALATPEGCCIFQGALFVCRKIAA